MSVSQEFTNHLFDYLTVNGKCAHHIDRPKTIFLDQGTILKITNVYSSSQIEFKINKEKLIKIAQKFFNTTIKLKCFVIEKIGNNSDKTNITIYLPKNLMNKIIVSDEIDGDNESIESSISISDISDDENINDSVEIVKDKYIL